MSGSNGNGRPHAGVEYWLAFLAASIKEALHLPPADGMDGLREALRRFHASPVCSAELRDHLTKERKP